MTETKVLFVCLGNICRSPMAEAIFKARIANADDAGLFYADSCGTADYHIGQQPDPRTIRNGKKNGVEMRHACRQLTTDDLQEFDYVLAMDQNNLNNIIRLSTPENGHKIFKMRHFDPVSQDADVPDPYHGDERDFQEVFEILDRSILHFLNYLRKRT